MLAVKPNARYKIWFFAVSLLLVLSIISSLLYLQFRAVPLKTLGLASGDFEHIQFSRRNPNNYLYQQDELIIEVDSSASFLMQAFDKVKRIKQVSFEWKSEGQPALDSAIQEASRAGDDAVFKLALLLETKQAIDEVFLPSWMRRVEALLQFPSAKMVFLVAGAKHEAGQRWSGPYNKRMTMISMHDTLRPDGWRRAIYQFSEPVSVVAIWLMADGDDTHSAFTVSIRDIRLEELPQEVVD